MANTHVATEADMSIHRTAKHLDVPFLRHYETQYLDILIQNVASWELHLYSVFMLVPRRKETTRIHFVHDRQDVVNMASQFAMYRNKWK